MISPGEFMSGVDAVTTALHLASQFKAEDGGKLPAALAALVEDFKKIVADSQGAIALAKEEAGPILDALHVPHGQ